MTGMTFVKRAVGKARSRMFDLRYGVRTDGDIPLEKLTIASPNARHGTLYMPTHPKAAREALQSLPVQEYSRYTLVDFGSGKGRVMLIAAEFPFRKIIGIEFAPELHAIAVENIRRYRNPRRRCFEIESFNMDVLDFPLPEGDGIYYFFFPFRRPVMEPLIERINQSLSESPRDILILYFNPELAELLDRASRFRLCEVRRYYRIYRSVPS